MPETVNLLEAAFAGELAWLKKMIDKLEDEDLHEFVRRLTEMRVRGAGGTPASRADDVLHVAQNIKRIEESLNNFYVV
jgi:ribosomal protein L12E/L44/L45/RPP1/RPP2